MFLLFPGSKSLFGELFHEREGKWYYIARQTEVDGKCVWGKNDFAIEIGSLILDLNRGRKNDKRSRYTRIPKGEAAMILFGAK